MKGRTKSHFTFFLKLNDHPTRCFNFGLKQYVGEIKNEFFFKNEARNFTF